MYLLFGNLHRIDCICISLLLTRSIDDTDNTLLKNYWENRTDLLPIIYKKIKINVSYPCEANP